jgi:hypothetical protein
VFATTGSNQFSGSQAITGSLTVTGQITAQTLNVQQVTSSIVFSSGSNVFGSSLSNTQQLTGSVSVTGSFTVTTTGTELQVTNTGVNLGNIVTDVHNVTGSLLVSGSMNVNGTPVSVGTGSNGQVTFWNGTTSQTGSNDLFWNNTNGRLGIGITNPSASLQVAGSSTPFGPETSGANPFVGLRVGKPGFGVILDMGTQPNTSPVSSWIQSRSQSNYSSNLLLALQPNGGNVTIGQLATDVGFRLDVAGSARIQGNTTIATNAGRLILSQSIAGSVFNGIDFTNFGGGTVGSLIMNQNTGEFRLSTANTYFPTFYSSGGEAARFSTNRNFLINTTTDSGFRLDVSGSTNLNGNTIVTGSFTVVTGSAIELQVTQTGVNIGNVITDFHTITGSLSISGSTNVRGPVTASTLLVSGSGTQRVIIQGSGSAQPIFTVQGSQGELFSITDSLSGSLFSVNDISGLPILEVFSNGDTLIGDYTAPAVYTTRRVASTTAGVNVIYSLATSSYDGIFVDYTIRSGSVGRAGNFMAMWSGTSADFTDNSINGFGITTNFVFGASISGSNLIVSGSGSTAGWTVKTIIRGI